MEHRDVRRTKDEKKTKKLHRFPSLSEYSHPSHKQLIERSDTLLCHFFLVPGSSLLFTNVSIDHRLHLMERVFAAGVIQLGVYHRALEHNKRAK